MDTRPFAGLAPAGYDLAVAWDYTDLSTDAWDGDLTAYGEIVVVGWSFGVAAASHFIASHPGLHITARMAVNGTNHPVDDSLGIPADIFRSTLDGLDERSVRKFHMRMCGGAAAARECASSLPARSVEELRAELEAIGGRNCPSVMWDRAFVSTDDLIIPPANQRSAWASEAYGTVTIPGPHLPDFSMLLSRYLTDKSLVAEKFAGAGGSYDSAAIIQRRIADRLLAMLPSHGGDAPCVLEIGPGTGYSSAVISRHMSPRRFDLWDLCLHPSLFSINGASPVEADAESMMFTAPDGCYDLVYTSSAIQWFNSLPAFMRNLERVLAPGGCALISTFGPRTMHEIHDALATTSTFHDTVAIRAMIPDTLVVEDIISEEELLLFPSPLDVLRHIKHTGVNATAPALGGATAARRLLSSYPGHPTGRSPLTYQPIYISLRKPL